MSNPHDIGPQRMPATQICWTGRQRNPSQPCPCRKPAIRHPRPAWPRVPNVARLGVFLLLIGPFAGKLTAQSWIMHEQRDRVDLYSEVQLPAERLFAELQAVEDEVSHSLNLTENRQAVQVVIFRSMRSYRDYLAERIPQLRNRRAIFYKNGDHLAVYAVYHNALSTDLRHEFTHALLHQSLPFIPLWIDEGVAEYFEETPEQRVRSKRLSAVRWKSRTGWSPSVSRLERIPSADTMNSNDYRDSWACVHYLLNHSDESRHLFLNYLSAISAGEAPGTFTEWTARHNSQVLKQVGSYFRKIRFSLMSRPRR